MPATSRSDVHKMQRGTALEGMFNFDHIMSVYSQHRIKISQLEFACACVLMHTC